MDQTRVSRILEKGNLTAEELGEMIGGNSRTIKRYLTGRGGIKSKRRMDTLELIERDIYKGIKPKVFRVPMKEARFNLIFTPGNIEVLKTIFDKESCQEPCRGTDICRDTGMSRQLVSQKLIHLRGAGGVIRDENHVYVINPYIKPLVKMVLEGTPLLTIRKITRVREAEIDCAMEFLSAAKRAAAQRKGAESGNGDPANQAQSTSTPAI